METEEENWIFILAHANTEDLCESTLSFEKSITRQGRRCGNERDILKTFTTNRRNKIYWKRVGAN